VLVTTGLRDDIPDIPGVRERWGRDLLHCPYCHGYEVRDQPLGVLAGEPSTVEESLAHAHLVRQWSDDVVFFANGAALSVEQRERLVARAIGIVDATVTRLVTRTTSSPASRPQAAMSCPGPRCSSGRTSSPTTPC
jgi:thioredoxin reductase